VKYQTIRQDESDNEEEEDDDLCLQYNVDALPPYEIDLDEIDQFLAQDIFIAEKYNSFQP
jgi:hypothetical protein